MGDTVNVGVQGTMGTSSASHVGKIVSGLASGYRVNTATKASGRRREAYPKVAFKVGTSRAQKRKRIRAKKTLEHSSATALEVCERALSLRAEDGGCPSASDATVYKVAHNLPASVLQLLQVLGSAWRLQKLLRACGGSSIRVPAVWAATANPLQKILGKRALKKLMETYGGTDLYIPRCAALVRYLRDMAILRDYALLEKKGVSLRQASVYLSTRYDLSERQVRNILNAIC